MENDSISSSSSESKLPLIVGIVGFALGAAGLVLALKAKSGADKASADVANISGSVAELSGQITAKANTSDVAALSGDLAQFKADSKTSFETLQASIEKVGNAKSKASTTGSTQFKADSKTSFETLQASIEKVGNAKSKASTTNGKAAVAGNGEYIIAKGDLLGTIAKKLGTSVQSLQELNPGINPNNLKIGSKIKTK